MITAAYGLTKALLRAGIPVWGVAIGKESDRTTWRIDYKPEATADQRTQGEALRLVYDVLNDDVLKAEGVGQVNILRIRNPKAGPGEYAQIWFGTDESIYCGSFGAFSSQYASSGPNIASGVKFAGDFEGGVSIVASHAEGSVRIYAANKLLAEFTPEGAQTSVRYSDGPNLIVNNGSKPVYHEFTRSGHASKVAIGMLGTPEANVSFNMDYADNTHKFYDPTQNAVWIALGHPGFTVQFAPAGATGDIYYNGGYDLMEVLANGNAKFYGSMRWGGGAALASSDAVATKAALDALAARVTALENG